MIDFCAGFSPVAVLDRANDGLELTSRRGCSRILSSCSSDFLFREIPFDFFVGIFYNFRKEIPNIDIVGLASCILRLYKIIVIIYIIGNVVIK